MVEQTLKSTTEYWGCHKWLFQDCESMEQEGEVPEQWAKSYTIPVYKGKGDVLMVDKHRGVRLLEQDVKVCEKL